MTQNTPHDQNATQQVASQPQAIRADPPAMPIQPPSSQPPRGLRVSVRKMLPFGIIVLAVSAFWTVFVAPTEDGAMAAIATGAIKRVSSAAGNSPAYTKVDYEIVRNTRGSILSHDVAQVFSGSERKSIDLKDLQGGGEALNKHLMASHAPGVVMAISKGFTGPESSCKVRLSAQALSYEGTPYTPLVNRMGSREDTFLLLLTHETAHCFWSPAMHFEKRMGALVKSGEADVQQMASLMPLVWNISESYSDAYALMLGQRIDVSFYTRALMALSEFRTISSHPTAAHFTAHAIAAAQALAPSLPAQGTPMAANWDITHRYAMSAALTGAMRWLVARGVPQSDAINTISMVLQGQNIEFALKNVGGQDFLIVTRAT